MTCFMYQDSEEASSEEDRELTQRECHTGKKDEGEFRVSCC